MFAERLRLLREEKKLTQKDLGKILNVSHQTISFWEKDKEPNFNTLKNIANYFNVSIDYLLGNTDVKNEIYKDHKLSRYINDCVTVYEKHINKQKDQE